MTTAFDQPVPHAIDPAARARRDEWVGRVRGLVDQLVAWSEALGWQVERTNEQVQEKPLGTY